MINSCEVDEQFGSEKQEKAKELFKDFKAGFSMPYFDGCTHGFAVRGDMVRSYTCTFKYLLTIPPRATRKSKRARKEHSRIPLSGSRSTCKGNVIICVHHNGPRSNVHSHRSLYVSLFGLVLRVTFRSQGSDFALNHHSALLMFLPALDAVAISSSPCSDSSIWALKAPVLQLLPRHHGGNVVSPQLV